MSRPALIREADIARIARAAAKAGCAAEVKIGNVVIRLLPNGKADDSRKDEAEERFIL